MLVPSAKLPRESEDNMSWTYRVMRHVGGKGAKKWYFYTIHEVYDDLGKISWTETEVSPCGESLEELRGDLEMMLAGTKKPVLDINTGKPVKMAENTPKTGKKGAK